MNVMDFFRGNQGTKQPDPQTMGNGLPVNAPNMNNMNQPTLPNMDSINTQVNSPAKQEEVKSPSEQLAELWKIEPAKDAPSTTLTAPTLNFDPAKVQQLSQGMDFTRGIMTAEDAAKVTAGGPEALAVMMQAINKASQNVFAQAVLGNAKIVQGSLDASVSNLTATLPNMVKHQNMQAAVANSNPVFTNPAVAPVLDLLKQQLIVAYPNATPTEIQQHANTAIMNLGQIVTQATTPQAKVADQAKAGQPDNWLTYLTTT